MGGGEIKTTIPRETGRREETFGKNVQREGIFLYFYTDIVHSRLSWPRGGFSENYLEPMDLVLEMTMYVECYLVAKF